MFARHLPMQLIGLLHPLPTTSTSSANSPSANLRLNHAPSSGWFFFSLAPTPDQAVSG